MKKPIIMFICCLMISVISLQAQKRGDFDRSAMLKEKLELTDDQSQKFDEMSESLKKEMIEIKSSDLPMEEKREKMKALGEKKKVMMAEILSPEQNEKLSELFQHGKKGKGKRGFSKRDMSPEEFEKRKAEMLAKHEEMKKFMLETVKPYMAEKRAELDKEMKRKDRKKVDQIRNLAKNLKDEKIAEMKAKREEMKKGFENGEKPPHFGPPHHRKKGKRGGFDKRHMKDFMNEYEEEFKQLESYATKYATEIDQIMAEVDTKRKEWKEEMKDIKDKHAFDKGGKKGGKERAKDGKVCCPEGKGSCDKSSKSKEGVSEDKIEKKKMMKRIAFLLAPSELEEPKEENREIDEVRTLTSKVFPNPSSESNTLEIEVTEAAKYSIDLYNEAGQKVRVIHNSKLNPGTEQFNVDLSGLPAGLYYYIISDGKNKSTQKFVKK